MTQEENFEITNFFFYCKIEGSKRLVSGNIWGTSPGRSFNFDLETHKFFDFAHPEHSGQGYKKLFFLRNEEFPVCFRQTYRKSQDLLRHDRQKQTHTETSEKPIFEKDPLPTVPHFFTQPKNLSIWKEGKKIILPATVYTYKNPSGQRIGFILRAEDPETGEKIVRPLTVWNRFVNKSSVLPCYRQKAFQPTLYNLDQIYAFPEKVIFVVEGEKCARFGAVHGAKQYDLPVIFTSWPFGAQAFNHPPMWEVLQPKQSKVLLWPDNDKPGIQTMREIKRKFLPTAKLLIPKEVGLAEGEDLADLPPTGDDFKRLLKNLIFCLKSSESSAIFE